MWLRRDSPTRAHSGSPCPFTESSSSASSRNQNGRLGSSGCGTVRCGSRMIRSPNRTRSTSRVRGPQRSARIRPASASASSPAFSNSWGGSSVLNNSIWLRYLPWGIGPRGFVFSIALSASTEVLGRFASLRRAASRCARRSPRFDPSATKTNSVDGIRPAALDDHFNKVEGPLDGDVRLACSNAHSLYRLHRQRPRRNLLA